MPRDTPVADVMTTDVLSLHTTDNVRDATVRLVEREIDGAPVLDDDGAVVGMLSSSDLIVSEGRLQFPTVVTLLGATLEWPSAKKRFDEDLEKALGATVGEVMGNDPVTCAPDDTIETAATLMHEHDVSRLPVVSHGQLVGIIARKDILRVIMRDETSADPA